MMHASIFNGNVTLLNFTEKHPHRGFEIYKSFPDTVLKDRLGDVVKMLTWRERKSYENFIIKLFSICKFDYIQTVKQIFSEFLLIHLKR